MFRKEDFASEKTSYFHQLLLEFFKDNFGKTAWDENSLKFPASIKKLSKEARFAFHHIVAHKVSRICESAHRGASGLGLPFFTLVS